MERPKTHFAIYILFPLVIAPVSGAAIGMVSMLAYALPRADVDLDYTTFLVMEAVPFGVVTGFVFGVLSLPAIRRVGMWRVLGCTGLGTAVFGCLGAAIGAEPLGWFLGMGGYWCGLAAALSTGESSGTNASDDVVPER